LFADDDRDALAAKAEEDDDDPVVADIDIIESDDADTG